jgi:hypothetical protein
MMDEASLRELCTAAEFLYVHHWAYRQTPNRRFTSYGWKHIAERWAGVYVSNGMFLAACYVAGLAVVPEPDNPNAYINLGDGARQIRKRGREFGQTPACTWPPPSHETPQGAALDSAGRQALSLSRKLNTPLQEA